MSRQYYVHSCQFCNRTIQLESHHTDINQLIEEHLTSCKYEALDKDKHSCSLEDCFVKQTFKNICNDCTLNFCDSHKKATDHSCSSVFSWKNASNNPAPQAPKKVVIENDYLRAQKNQKEELDKLRKEMAQIKQELKTQEGLQQKAEKDQIEELRKIRENRRLEYESDDISVCVTVILSNNDKLTAQFNKQDTLKKIQEFVNRNRSDGVEPYALCLNATGQPLSKNDINKTIQQLQLLPTPTLYVILIKDLKEQIKEVKRANDLRGYFFSNKYLEMAILVAALFFVYYLYKNYQKEPLKSRNRHHPDHHRRGDYDDDYYDYY
ncbi:hypothetical protein ACTFIR_001986 [Dictyostelium discoideum]